MIKNRARAAAPPAGERPPSFADRVYEAVGEVPPGECLSYGDIAALAGNPGAARAVGRIMARSQGLPWWRVVAADGRLVPGKESEHARLLAAEGVPVTDNRVTG